MSDGIELKNITVPVSVVIPCFRSATVIRRALESVRAQTRQPVEVIVVDDCSNDGTLKVLETLIAEYGDNWLKVIALEKNGGPGTARNVGWDAATGDYVAFLDADDAWHPRKLEVQYRWMASHPEYVITGHARMVVNDSSVSQSAPGDVIFHAISRWQLLAKNYFSTQTVMVRRNIAFRFRPGKRHSEDYLLASQICCNGLKCGSSSAELAYLYKEVFGESGLSGDLWEMEKGELDVYSSLWHDGLISSWERWGFSVFSSAKFLRRCLLVGVRKISG